jgi:hypothetical protein
MTGREKTMDCPKCGYAMSEFDTECPRCKRITEEAAQRKAAQQDEDEAQAPAEQQPSQPPPAAAPQAIPEDIAGFAQNARRLGKTVSTLLIGFGFFTLYAAIISAVATAEYALVVLISGVVGAVSLWVAIWKMTVGFASGLAAVSTWLQDQYSRR